MDEKLTVMDGDLNSESDFVMVNRASIVESVFSDDECFVKQEDMRATYDIDSSVCHKLDIGEDCTKKGEDEAFASSNDILFHLDSSWSGGESGPWWRTDAEELALLVSQRSLSLMENCDLPLPQDSHEKKALSDKRNSFCHYKTSTPSIHQDLVQPPSVMSSNDSSAGNMVDGISFQKHRFPSEIKLRGEHGEVPKKDKVGEDNGHLLEALRHSQTRARESEEAAKQACAEREHIVKLLLRQASHLFAYKQWFQVLQLEVQMNKSQQSESHLQRLRRTNMSKKRGKSAKSYMGCDIGKYAIVFAWGLGLVSAGLMLGWGIAWIW